MAATPWTAAPASANFAHDIVLMKQTGIDPWWCMAAVRRSGRMLETLAIPSHFVDGLRVTDESHDGSGGDGAVRHHQQADRYRHQCRRRPRGGIVGQGRQSGDGAQAGTLPRSILARSDEKLVDLRLCRRAGQSRSGSAASTSSRPGAHSRDRRPSAWPQTGETFNINADTVSGAVAGALKAERLLLLDRCRRRARPATQTDPAAHGREARRLIADGTISGGMIPKIETAIEAVEARCRSRRHPGWPDPPCPAARTFHRAWRRHAHSQLIDLCAVNRACCVGTTRPLPMAP